MPTLTRWYVKTSLVYFVGALLAGVLLAARAVWPLPELAAGLSPVYFHMFLLGWITQLIMGIVLWMFPKYSKERPRGNEGLAMAT